MWHLIGHLVVKLDSIPPGWSLNVLNYLTQNLCKWHSRVSAPQTPNPIHCHSNDVTIELLLEQVPFYCSTEWLSLWAVQARQLLCRAWHNQRNGQNLKHDGRNLANKGKKQTKKLNRMIEVSHGTREIDWLQVKNRYTLLIWRAMLHLNSDFTTF